MVQVATAETPLHNPRGFHAAKVDSAGRLKLPAAIHEYLDRLADKTLIVGLLKGTARIYTNGSFDNNLAKLDSKPALRAAISMEMDRTGGNVSMDPQHRITLPQTLRKEMELEEQTVHLRFYDDVVFMYTQTQFEEVTGAARKAIEENFGDAEELGFV